jgi:hypothetical protein
MAACTCMSSQAISHTITYKRPSLEVEYDYVGIIDGLTCADRLRYEITEELTDLLVAGGVQVAIARVNNKLELLASLEAFRKEAVEGKKFMLHFVAHGNEGGIAAAEEFCQWTELRPFLQRVHAATNETLLLNMSTCKGLHGIKATDHSGPFPFFGLIGATADLLVEDAKAANRKIYEKWLAGLPVQRLVHETNSELGKELLFHISSEGYRILTEPM